MSESSRSIWSRVVGILIGIVVVGLLVVSMNAGFRSWWSGQQAELVDRDQFQPRDPAAERRAREERRRLADGLPEDDELPAPRLQPPIVEPPDEPPIIIDPPPSGTVEEPPYDGPAGPLVRMPPAYPACADGQKGEALVEFFVEPDGTLSETKIVEATSDCFADAALKVLPRWRYRPEIVDGESIRSGPYRVKMLFEPVNDDIADGPPESDSGAKEPGQMTRGEQPADDQ